jgi:hypothetical protein
MPTRPHLPAQQGCSVYHSTSYSGAKSFPWRYASMVISEVV